MIGVPSATSTNGVYYYSLEHMSVPLFQRVRASSTTTANPAPQQLISGSVVDRGISVLYCLPPETQDCSQSASALPLWEEARAKCDR